MLALVVVLLGGAGLGALRVTPSDDGADDQAFDVVDTESSTSTTALVVTTTTAPVATTAPPTTAAPPSAPTPRPPLSPLPPAPTTTARPQPPPTSPTTAAPRAPVARNDGSPGKPIAVPRDSQAFPIRVTGNDTPNGTITQMTAHGGRNGSILSTDPGEGVVYYSPPAGFTGSDVFQYTIWNDSGQQSTANVHVQVS